MAADQCVLNMMTEDGHQALSQYVSCGYRGNDAHLDYRWFALVGLQPSADYQTEAMADFLNYHKSCTHACIILREITDFHLSVAENFHLSYFEELPEGAVLQAGYNGTCGYKFYKYHLVRQPVIDAMLASKLSPVAPPVPKRRRAMFDDDEEDDDSNGVLPSINLLLAEGFDTPKADGPQKKLYFATPGTAQNNAQPTQYDALFHGLSSGTNSLQAASPGDSMAALKGSPLMESPMSGLIDLTDFRDPNQSLMREAEEADGRLAEAEKALADLQSCDDDSAASTLARMHGKSNSDQINRRLQRHEKTR